MSDPGDNPMRHPDEQPTGTDGEPRFGRLLMVLGAVVLLIVALAFASTAFY